MSLKKIERISVVDDSRIAMHNWGDNLFIDSKCKIVDLNTGEKPDMKAWVALTEECIQGDSNERYLCDKERNIQGNDIMTDKVDIIYDLGRITDVSQIYIKSHFNASTNYTLSEFEIYAALSEDTLFDSENLVTAEKPENDWYVGCMDMAKWLYKVEGTARYIALRVIKSNPTDDITRIKYLGAYSDTETKNGMYKKRNYLSEKRHTNILKGMEPKILTDGLLYDKTVAVSGKETFNFTFNEKTAVNYIWVIGKGEFEAEVKGFNLEKITSLEDGRKEVLLKNDSEKAIKTVSVTVKGDCEIDQIGAYNNKRYMKVDFEDVICDDYLGIGACVIPSAMMPESRGAGYNEVYWEMEKCRIDKVRPHIVRSWFQLDWILDNYDDYKNGNYHFDSERMKAMYYHFDAYKASGVDIAFNFGWKIPEEYAEWFGFPNIRNPRAAAPRELDLFAKCCAATLKYLIEVKGYDNIKYLTLYNEPNGAGDFSVGDGYSDVEYWSMMLNECHKAVKEAEIDIKIWGMEVGCNSYETLVNAINWIEYMKEHSPNKLDAFNLHRYCVDEETALMEFPALLKAAEDKPMVISEFGQNWDYNNDQTWEMNNTQLFCNLTQCGFSGALVWCLSGIILPIPCDFAMANTTDMLGLLCMPGGIASVREPFYELAMLSRYVPNHWKSVKSSVVDNMGENRIAAFTNGEDYTVVVEVKDFAFKRDIEVKFGKKLGKKFYKHLYKIPYCRDGNAIIPPVCGEIYAEDTLKDTVNSGYQAIVYTTLPPVTQIRVGTPELCLVPGQNFVLSGEVVDGDGKILWEKTKEIGRSITVGLDGKVRVSKDAQSGDMCAIKAYSEDNPDIYTVVIVKIG